MTSVGIIDYGMGNLDSVARAVDVCGGDPVVSADPSVLGGTAKLVLPGVGAFGDGMAHLEERGLDTFLREQVERHEIPVLGICLGMQLLATEGTENQVDGGARPGLDLVPGRVVRFAPEDPETRVPHVGWNEVRPVAGEPLFDGVAPGTDVYFVHSFHLEPADEADVAAWTPYAGRFASAVSRGSVRGVQFHPEKSQRVGFQILRNYLRV